MRSESLSSRQQKAAMLGQDYQKPIARRRYQNRRKSPQTDDDHHNNRGDFDHRKPEFDFTTGGPCARFANATSPDGNQRRYPPRHLRNQN